MSAQPAFKLPLSPIGTCLIHDADGKFVAECMTAEFPGHIVEAVNAYASLREQNAALLAALERCADLAENSDGQSVSARLCGIVDAARAAIASVKDAQRV